MTASLSVSAVVVNYKSAALTVACVASLRAAGVDEVIVVDSASDDGCERLLHTADAHAVFVALSENRGYGAAANAGARVGTKDVVLISNADIEVEPGTVTALLAVLERDPAAGAVGPRIDRPDGTRYPSARAFPSLMDAIGHGSVGLVTTSNPWSRRYLRTDRESAGEVDWVSGSFFVVRRAAWDQLGGFDESYFMFSEDVDLCWRLKRAGWSVAYEPAGRVVHLEGASRASAPYRMIVAHHVSLLRFGWRSGRTADRLAMPFVAVGLLVRTGVLCARTALRSRR